MSSAAAIVPLGWAAVNGRSAFGTRVAKQADARFNRDIPLARWMGLVSMPPIAAQHLLFWYYCWGRKGITCSGVET